MGRCEYQSRDIDALIEPTKTFKWGGVIVSHDQYLSMRDNMSER